MEQKNNGIWILLDSRKPGGIESHVLQLARGLHNHNKNVTVVFLTHYENHPLRVDLQQFGINTLCLDGRITTLWREIQKAQPLILHTHGYKAGILGRIVAMF